MKTTVVHCKKDEYDKSIVRPSMFGNPFKIGLDGTRADVCDKHMEWLEDPEEVVIKVNGVKYSNRVVRENVHKLKGLRIACWCAPKRCHGNNLVNLFELQDKQQFVEL